MVNVEKRIAAIGQVLYEGLLTKLGDVPPQ
jgi:hypothetical protein